MAATAAAAAGRDAIDAMDVDGAAPRAAVPGPQQLFLALASGSVEAIANIRRHGACSTTALPYAGHVACPGDGTSSLYSTQVDTCAKHHHTCGDDAHTMHTCMCPLADMHHLNAFFYRHVL